MKQDKNFTALFSDLKVLETNTEKVNNAIEAMQPFTDTFEGLDLDKLKLTKAEQKTLQDAADILEKLQRSFYDKAGILGKSILKIA